MSEICTSAMFKQATVALVLTVGSPAMVSAERPGESAGRLASVIDRLHTAEVVIQQTCGASIFEPAADN